MIIALLLCGNLGRSKNCIATFFQESLYCIFLHLSLFETTFPQWHHALNAACMTDSVPLPFVGSSSVILLPLKCWGSKILSLTSAFLTVHNFYVWSSLCSWFQLSSVCCWLPELSLPPTTPLRLYTPSLVGCFHIAHSISHQYIEHCSCYLTLNTPVLPILVGGTISYPLIQARNASSFPIISSANFVSHKFLKCYPIIPFVYIFISSLN